MCTGRYIQVDISPGGYL